MMSRLMFQACWLCSILAGMAVAHSAAPPRSGDAISSSRGSSELLLKALGPAAVGRHERIEFTLEWERRHRNPCDPDEVAVELEITTPSGAKRRMPAFFHQPFEWRLVERGGRKVEWIYPAGPAGWRARFAPDDTGTYSAVAVARDAQGTLRSTAVAFTCVASSGKGGLRVSRRDPRFFEFEDGTPFFAIGQNVAFIGESQYLDTEKAAEVFRKMSENGANWARVWTGAEDWALAIEARKSAWGRSWGGKGPLAPMPVPDGSTTNGVCVRLGGTNLSSVTVSPSHSVALRAGTAYRLAGRGATEAEAALVIELQGGALGTAIRGGPDSWTSFERTFTAGPNQWWLGELRLRATGQGRVWLRELSLQEASGGPELLWEADTERPVRGVYNQPDCFMLDRIVEAAEKRGLYLQLCLFTRDLYRLNLRDPQSAEYQRAIDDAKKFLRYAVARWGYSTSVFAWEYFNEMDPGAPTDRFYRELGEYLEKTDLYDHLRTVSAWSPAPKYWAHAQLDIADLHWYLRPISKPAWQDEVAAVLDRAQLVRQTAPSKPALLAEFGLADDKWGRSPYMPQDKTGVHFHNALWASAFSGLSGTAMFWWWETLDQNNLYHHYRPLAAFLADIPFTTAQLQPAAFTTEKQSRALAWRGKDRAYVWFQNPQATWWNLVAEKKALAEVANDALSLDGLEDGNYRLEWWDTTTGKVTKQKSVTASDGKLSIQIPAFTHDIACKLVK